MKKSNLTIKTNDNSIITIDGYPLNEFIFASKVKGGFTSWCAMCGIKIMDHKKLKDVINDIQGVAAYKKTILADHFKSHTAEVKKEPEMITVKVNEFIAATPIADGTWNVHCSKCNEHFMFLEGKTDDIIKSIKGLPLGCRNFMAKHIKSHDRDDYIPKTVKKGENVKALKSLDLFVKEILAGVRGFYSCEAVQPLTYKQKELDMNFKLDFNYIPNTDSIGNVSAYYVNRTIDEEAQEVINSINNKPKVKTYISNLMLNNEYDYVSAEKEDEDRYALVESEPILAIDYEVEQDQFMEDIVRGKFVPKGLKGANILIGWFMSHVKKDPVTKMHQYCRAVKVDKETMKLINFKMGAKLPSLEKLDDQLEFMDHMYSPDEGGIADESKTHKSLEYLRFERGMVKWLPKKNSIAIDIIVQNKGLLSDEEKDYWRYMVSNGGVELSKQMKFFIMRAKRITQIPELQEAYAKYLNERKEVPVMDTDKYCESIYPWLHARGRLTRIKQMVAMALPDYTGGDNASTKKEKKSKAPTNKKPKKEVKPKGNTKKTNNKKGDVGTPSTELPRPNVLDSRKVIVRVYPAAPEVGLKEGFVVGMEVLNGSITQYISGRSFDTIALCKRVEMLYGRTHSIQFVTMSHKDTSYKAGWNAFIKHTASHKDTPCVKV